MTHSRPRPRLPVTLAVLLPTVAAVALTSTRLPFRWNQIALAYAANYREYFRGLHMDGWSALFTQFVGIHPPAYSMVFLAMTEVGVSPLTWFVVSGSFSVGAVLAVGLAASRAGLGAGCVAMAATLLAVSPHRLAYSLEPNNYPLLLLVVAVQAMAFADFVRHERRGFLLGGSTLLGLWTHALFVTVPIAQAAALARGPQFRRVVTAFGVAAALCLPLVPSVLEGSGSIVNPGGGVGPVLQAMLIDFPARYGSAWAAWLVAIAAAVGVFRIPRSDDAAQRAVLTGWTLQLLVGAGLLALLLARGTAATHQFPYYLLLLPPACLLAGAAFERLRPSLVPLLTLLIAASAASSVTYAISESNRARRLWRDATVTHPTVTRALDAWTEGSSLLLLGYPEGGDDDKDVVDAAYALLPHDRPVNHEEPRVETLVGGDPYWGQPYGFFGDRWLYTYTSFLEDRWEAIFEATRGRGERLVVTIYPANVSWNDTQAALAWSRRHGIEPLTHDDAVVMVFGPGPL